MGNIGGETVQTARVGVHHAHARRKELLAHLAHALVAPRRVDVDRFDRFGLEAQTGADGMKAGEDGVLHGNAAGRPSDGLRSRIGLE